MEIFGETIERELPDLAQAGRAHALHRPPRPRARASCGERMAELEARDRRATTRLDLWIAFDYGGRAEIVEAARRLVEDGVARTTSTRTRSRRTSTRPSCPTRTC